MAEYEELHAAVSDSGLLIKTQVAVTVAANEFLKSGATPTAPQLAWASAVVSNPIPEAKKALRLMLAANKDVAIATILGSDKGAVQSQVDGVVPNLIAALPGA